MKGYRIQRWRPGGVIETRLKNGRWVPQDSTKAGVYHHLGNCLQAARRMSWKLKDYRVRSHNYFICGPLGGHRDFRGNPR